MPTPLPRLAHGATVDTLHTGEYRDGLRTDKQIGRRPSVLSVRPVRSSVSLTDQSLEADAAVNSNHLSGNSSPLAAQDSARPSLSFRVVRLLRSQDSCVGLKFCRSRRTRCDCCVVARREVTHFWRYRWKKTGVRRINCWQLLRRGKEGNGEERRVKNDINE